MEARRLRRQLATSPVKLTGKGQYALVLAETEDRAAAEKALQDYIWNELKRDNKPEV